MKRNLPKKWDQEFDFVAIGSGIGGLSGAIAAHEAGARAVVLEASEQVGGVTALSQGEVWVPGNRHAADLKIEDSVDSGFRYLQRLSMGYGSDAAILNFVVNARRALDFFEEHIGLKMLVIRDAPDYYYTVSNDSVAEGRLLECAPFHADTLGDWQERTRISPHVPYALTHEDMFSRGGLAHMMDWDHQLMAERLVDDVRCAGPGLAGYFVKGALDRGISMQTGTRAEQLIGDGERIVGVRAVRDGSELFFKANTGVLIATSSYEQNPDYSKAMSHQLELGTMLFSGITGSHFRLAGPFGARTAVVPDITPLGFVVPNQETAEGHPFWMGVIPFMGLPHVIVVNRAGKRFGNEAFYRQFLYLVEQIDGLNQIHPNFPCWMILDSQAKRKYPIGTIMPDMDWPGGFGARADTLGDLARQIGADPEGLEVTVARFNENAERGEDPDFGRGQQPWSATMNGDHLQKPNTNLGPLIEPPFYAVELSRMGATGIPAAGLLTDQHSRVIGWDDQSIAGLYAAGNSVARMETGAAMQSGISNARGMTYGWLAARHATGTDDSTMASETQRMGL